MQFHEWTTFQIFLRFIVVFFSASENETLIPTSEKVDTILTIVSTLVEDQKDGPTAEKLRYSTYS